MYISHLMMVIVKTGRSAAIIVSLFSIGYALGKINKSRMSLHTSKTTNAPTKQQYENRLVEFFDTNLESAVTEYCEYIEMGFNPSDAFEIAKARAHLC